MFRKASTNLAIVLSLALLSSAEACPGCRWHRGSSTTYRSNVAPVIPAQQHQSFMMIPAPSYRPNYSPAFTPQYSLPPSAQVPTSNFGQQNAVPLHYAAQGNLTYATPGFSAPTQSANNVVRSSQQTATRVEATTRVASPPLSVVAQPAAITTAVDVGRRNASDAPSVSAVPIESAKPGPQSAGSNRIDEQSKSYVQAVPQLGEANEQSEVKARQASLKSSKPGIPIEEKEMRAMYLVRQTLTNSGSTTR
jgi:hypothetical protein